MNDRAQPYLQVVHALVAGREPPGERLLGLREDIAAVLMHDRTVALVINPSKRGAELEAAIRDQLELDRQTHVKLVIVGGGPDMREVLSHVQPGMLSRRHVQAYHLGADGTVWSGRSSSLDTPVGRALQAVAEQKDAPAISFEDLAALVPRISAEEHAEVRSAFDFVQRFRSRRPLLTQWLLVGLLVVFALEILWGGGDSLPTLVRMGANTEATLGGGEPWRLLASVWLHAGEPHLIANGLVLWLLGREMERIFGWARLAILFVVSGLCGSLASALVSEGLVAVGASGAIWGVIASAGAIAWKPRGLLPPTIAHHVRRAAGINLIVGLAASFLPQVDLWAHLGGGAAGAALVLSGVLTRGLTPLHTQEEAPPPEQPRVRGIAMACLAILVGALVVAIAVGRPWELGRAPSMVAHEVDGFTVELPAALGDPEPFEDGSMHGIVVGDPTVDPLCAIVMIESEPAELAPPDHADAIVLVERHEIAGAPVPTFEEHLVYASDFHHRIRVAFFRDVAVTIEILWGPGTSDAWLHAAERTATSLEDAR